MPPSTPQIKLYEPWDTSGTTICPPHITQAGRGRQNVGSSLYLWHRVNDFFDSPITTPCRANQTRASAMDGAMEGRGIPSIAPLRSFEGRQIFTMSFCQYCLSFKSSPKASVPKHPCEKPCCTGRQGGVVFFSTQGMGSKKNS